MAKHLPGNADEHEVNWRGYRFECSRYDLVTNDLTEVAEHVVAHQFSRREQRRKEGPEMLVTL